LTAQSGVGASISRLWYKTTENCKFRRAILSAFYNISQRNFGILLILWCSFKLWWNFCLDQNLVYNANSWSIESLPLFATIYMRMHACMHALRTVINDGLFHWFIWQLIWSYKKHYIVILTVCYITVNIALIYLNSTSRLFKANVTCLPKAKSTLRWRIVASYNTVHRHNITKYFADCMCSYVLKYFKAVFHFGRTVPKRIKKIFKLQNLVMSIG
jgi:hypothetical protein